MAPGNPARPPPQTTPYPEKKKPSRPGAAPAAGAPRAAAAPAGPAPGAAEVAQFEALFEKMKSQTHFQVLGLARDSEIGAVKMAYLKLARSYHPDTVPPSAPQALAKAKADIFARIGEANRVLSDPGLRADYLAELAAGGTGEKVDVAQILQAEELFAKAEIMVRARKYAEAVTMLDEAIAANPEEGEFYALRGFAKFFTFKDKKEGRGAAQPDLNQCLNRNPNVGKLYYYLGYIAKVLGDTAEAKKQFQKCVSLDKGHVDAQRELRLMK